MKRLALYLRVSTLDQHPETQMYDLHQMAEQRGYQIVKEYEDRISGAKARRPGLDAMMRDARRGKFDVVLVWACDRIARSTKHFLEVLDELNRLNIEFISFREQIDTGGPLGRAIMVIVGAVAELERSFIVERVRAGMRRAQARRPAHRTKSSGPRSSCHPPRPAERSEPGPVGEGPPGIPHDHPSGPGRANPGRYKRPRKTRRLNPTESRAGSTRSGCSTNCGLRNNDTRGESAQAFIEFDDLFMEWKIRVSIAPETQQRSKCGTGLDSVPEGQIIEGQGVVCGDPSLLWLVG